MLALRSVVSLSLLVAVALAYALRGRPDPVAASPAWWLWFVTAANVASIALMVRFARLEGLRLRDVYFFDRATWRGDLIWAGVFVVGTALVAMPPGTLLAGWLWDDANTPNDLRFQPLPLLAVYPLLLLMPVTQGLAELPAVRAVDRVRRRSTADGAAVLDGAARVDRRESAGVVDDGVEGDGDRKIARGSAARGRAYARQTMMIPASPRVLLPDGRRLAYREFGPTNRACRLRLRQLRHDGLPSTGRLRSRPPIECGDLDAPRVPPCGVP